MAGRDGLEDVTVDGPVGRGPAAQNALVHLAAGQIEAALWSVNDRIRELAPEWNGMQALACECANPRCMSMLSIPARVFDELRAAPRRFVVSPGHERAGSETLVLCADNYFIVSRPSLLPSDSVIRP
jgi:hypothetical protein